MKTLAPGYVLRDDGVIEIDPDIVYPALMAELGIADAQLDRYTLTLVHQCAKYEAQRLASAEGIDRRDRGVALELRILPGRAKQRWQLRRHREGRGEALALRHAPKHFARLRGEA